MKNIKVFGGNANPSLNEGIASLVMEGNLSRVNIGRFADGEIRISELENVRGLDSYIIQSTSPPAENLLELLFLADTLKRASGKTVTAVIPYFGYGRQDRKCEVRGPITASAVARLIEASRIDRIVTMDLHTDQLEAIFNIPVNHIHAYPALLRTLKARTYVSNMLIIAPDIGAIKMARKYAEALGVGFAWVDKKRSSPNACELLSFNGANIDGKDLIILDDMIDTGGTVRQVAIACKEYGPNSITLVATHGVFGRGAYDRLQSAPIDELIVTNTLSWEDKMDKANRTFDISTVDVSYLFAKAINNLHSNHSLKELCYV